MPQQLPGERSGRRVLGRSFEQKRGWGFIVGNIILRPTMWAMTTRVWINEDRIPSKGGCILVINHLSHLDPVFTAHLVYDRGRLPRYLAKSSLFTGNRFVAGVLRSAGQIPVERLSQHAVGAYDAAVAAVESGECVVVYPEGTLTRDPDLWPMRGKSGAARIALATGVPVIPVAIWGVQDLLAPYARRPRLWPRARVTLQVGDPVPLEDLRAGEIDAALVGRATDRIMSSLVAILEEIREEKAPAERFDPRQAGMKLIGNPRPDHRPTKKRET